MKFRNPRAYLLFFYCFVIAGLSAQGGRFQFEQLSSTINIPNRTINAILQDHKGFLWIGTWSGLFRYDGYGLKAFRQSNLLDNQLGSNKITCLFEDSKNRLWIGTRNSGFYRYERSQEKFIQYKSNPNDPNSLSNNNVWVIYEDRSGYIWVGTEKGLNRFDPNENSFLAFLSSNSKPNTLSNCFVYSIAQSSDGSLWVGTENGLNRMTFDPQLNDYKINAYSLSQVEETLNEEKPELDNYIYKIINARYTANTLWVGTKSGLKKVSFKAPSISRGISVDHFQHSSTPNSISNNFVSDILEVGSNSLWVATFEGLNLINTKNKEVRQFFSQPSSNKTLNNNRVKSLYLDRTDILWVGTEKGINKLKLNNKPFFSIQLDQIENSNNNVVVSLEKGIEKHTVWAGTRGGGLNKIIFEEKNQDAFKIVNYTFNNIQVPDLAKVTSQIQFDSFGYLWIATQGAGLLQVKASEIQDKTVLSPTQFLKGIQSTNISDDYVMSLTQTVKGNLWLGHWDGGLDLFNRANNEFISFTQTSNDQLDLTQFPNVVLLESVSQDEKFLWVGTRGNGLYKLKYEPIEKKLMLVQHFELNSKDNNRISNNFINALFEDKNGNLWVGTENGLNYLPHNAGKFTFLLEKDGLADRIIQDIIEDEVGRIWVSTQNGLSCLHNFNQKLVIRNFDIANGLQDNFFNSKASCHTQEDKLVFGGANGISIISSSKIELDTIPPLVTLTDFKLFNESVGIGERVKGKPILDQSISEAESITLNYNENVISFEVAMLHFAYPSNNHFAYKLEGFDKNWNYPPKDQRYIHYTNLPYDAFTLKIKAANGDGVWSNPITLDINVKPPFWLTNWAYLLYFICFLGILWGVRALTLMRVNLNNKIKLEQLEKEKLKEVNDVKLKFFTNISHELRTPLTLIMSPLEQLIKNHVGDKKTKSVYARMYHNANKLLNMINQLLDIRKSEAGLFRLEAAEGNFVKFIDEIILSFKGIALQNQITLTFNKPPHPIYLWYDRDQMEKVMFNLLSNALKFTPEGGKIDIRLNNHPENQTLILEVQDNGCGIEANKLPHIFDRFYQAEHTNGSTFGGTGIGLALVNSIIKAHHGKIKVSSEIDQGTCFSIHLKHGKEHFSQEDLIQNFRNSEHPSHYVLNTGFEHKAPVVIGSKKDGEKSLLLIVEDNEDIRSYLKENLHQDYQIIEASNGEEGLELAQKESPNLIISDIAMPKMDGLEMCQKIKSNIITSHIPIILLTARTSLIFKIDGFETGADDYITKPFNMKLLRTRIANLLATRQRLWKKFSEQMHVKPSEINVSSLDEEFLKKAIDLVETHIDDFDFSVEKLAQAMHMSRMQLYRKIKTLTNNNPNTFIRTLRLKRAAQLLEAKRYTIAEVTYKVGFQDLKYFRERFKKEFGLSPSEYVAKIK